jgi:small subunit ribosomal protein S2
VIADAMNEGLQEGKAMSKENSGGEEEHEDAPPRRERRTKSFAKKERVKKTDDEAINAAVISRVAKGREEE